MGADFLYAVADMSIDKDTLVSLVNGMDYHAMVGLSNAIYLGDIEDDEEWVQESKKELIDHINVVYSSRDSREVGYMNIKDTEYLITGGMSWGDEPTDHFRSFEVVQELQHLYRRTNEN